MTKHIVTGIKPYDFVNEDGERLQGVKVFYLDNDPEDSAAAKGFFPLNLAIVGDHVDEFAAVPGIYDLDFKQASDKFGRPVLRLRSVSFVDAVELPTV